MTSSPRITLDSSDYWIQPQNDDPEATVFEVGRIGEKKVICTMKGEIGRRIYSLMQMQQQKDYSVDSTITPVSWERINCHKTMLWVIGKISFQDLINCRENPDSLVLFRNDTRDLRYPYCSQETFFADPNWACHSQIIIGYDPRRKRYIRFDKRGSGSEPFRITEFRKSIWKQVLGLRYHFGDPSIIESPASELQKTSAAFS